MSLAVWAFIFQLVCVATKRIHVGHQLGRDFAKQAPFPAPAPKEVTLAARPASQDKHKDTIPFKPMRPTPSPSGEEDTIPFKPMRPEPSTMGGPNPMKVAGSSESPPPLEHFWARRGGDQRMDSDVDWMAPTNLSRPSWTWENPLGEQVRHSPLIDRNADVYITTGTRVRKFHGRTGAMMWTWESPGAAEKEIGLEIVTCPVLDGDALLLVMPGLANVTMFSIDLATGVVNWQREHTAQINGDGNALLAMNGAVVFATRNPFDPQTPGLGNPNRQVTALSTKDGSHLWDYALDGVVWNFAPASPGDGTMVFSSSCGTAYRLDFRGHLLWKSSWDVPLMCSAGGGALGPDGVFYMSWSYGSPGNMFAAIRLEDGAKLWNKTIVFGDGGAAQYPAVGKLGKDGPLAMVVAVGNQPSGTNGAEPEGARILRNAVVALDAATGDELWFSEEAPWLHPAGAGDELKEMIPRQFLHPTLSPVCYPDAQGIPLITGDGTVYASSSHHGDLRAIRTTAQKGDSPAPELTAEEVSIFHPGLAFLNSPSTAPGMLVAAPCWGPTFVFLSEE